MKYDPPERNNRSLCISLMKIGIEVPSFQLTKKKVARNLTNLTRELDTVKLFSTASLF